MQGYQPSEFFALLSESRNTYNLYMDELTIDEKVYVSSKRAAKITGYAKDYVGQLCREGRVDARLVGRNWYVLEASIMEHRFGATPTDQKEPAAETVREATEPAIQISKAVTDTWDAPSYQPEVPAVLPSLEVKESIPTADTRKVVSEMQEAWQEWFAERKPGLETLPGASSEFDGHLVPIVRSEDREAEESAVVEDQPVLITRLEHQAPEINAESVSLNDAEGVVHLHRTQTQAAVGEVEDLRQSVRLAPVVQGSNLVLKSIFVGIAFVAVCIALAGTGVLSDSLAATGIAQPLVDAVNGSWEYKSIK